MSDNLIKNYEEIADLFEEHLDEFSSKVITKKAIEEFIDNHGIKRDTYFQPSDVCYNHKANPYGGEDDFDQIVHIFEYLGWNKYKVLGKNYPYTGNVVQKIDGKEVIVGEWLNGRLIKWNRKQQVAVSESLEREMQLIQSISDEVDELEINGEEKLLLTKTRLNQNVFRDRLLKRYSKCCLCGVTNTSLLIASHIKPWAESESSEKLDVNNGFLFCPNHDALFDKGYISFDDSGKILISERLDMQNRIFMNVREDMKVEICDKNIQYLNYHRNHIFE